MNKLNKMKMNKLNCLKICFEFKLTKQQQIT